MYSLIEIDNLIISQGLKGKIDKEFSIIKKDYQIEDVRLVIDHILEFLTLTKSQINNLETFGCGSWMLQFVFDKTYIELHELKEIKNGKNVYEFGLTDTIKFLRSQLELCALYNVNPVIPRLGQKIAVSKEIYEGSEVNAVRYDSPDHMSGWYLTSNAFNGDVKELLVDHLYYLLKSRPEIAKFLALPSGFRFFKDNLGQDVWYDKDVVTKS